MARRRQQIAPLIGVVLCLTLWVVVAAALGDLRRFLPWPWVVALHLVRTLGTAQCWLDIALTAARTVVAFAIGAVVGVPAGLLLGLNPKYYEASRVAIDFVRSVPVTALFPVAMLFLGIGDTAKLACVALGCALIVLVHSAGAVRNTPFLYGLVARSLRLTRWGAFGKVTLPASLPEIANGLRVASSIALILVVVLEMFVGSAGGLGLRLYDDQQLFRISDMYGTLLLIGGLGYLANWGLGMMQERFLHWSGK
jgi:NitT/TauT family transport system permease protein